MMGFELMTFPTAASLTTMAQVVAIDLMLAGDNVLVLGALTAGLPPRDRRLVLAGGVSLALVCLVCFALIATRLLNIPGLLLVGGLLLFWVAWRLFVDLSDSDGGSVESGEASNLPQQARSTAKAAVQVAIADLSMSLDNVLAVAGAARSHPGVLAFGLVLSVALMAVAANLIAGVIERHRWVGYVGVILIIYVGATMAYQGIFDPRLGIVHML